MYAHRELCLYRIKTVIIILLVLVPGLALSLQYGVITPQNPFVFEGKTLRLYCNITDPSVRENSSSLSFQKGNEPRISQILTTRAIRLNIPEVTLDDEGSYSCLVTTMEGKVKVVGNQSVNVDIQPRQVVNVQCRVYNWEEMTCTWEQDVRYNHPNHVNISVFWVTTMGQVVSSEDVQQDCPWLSSNSCHWDRDHYRHGHRYSIRIAVTYRVGGQVLDQASKIVTVNTIELVEPAPVQGLGASAKNSTCIILSWQIPRVMLRSKAFIVQIRKPGLKWKDVVSRLTSENNENHSSHESLVCGLDRNSQYYFRVAVMPLFFGREQGFRSEWESTSAFTDEDVPSAAPSICSGCFFEVSNAHQDFTGTRQVRIMWKDIPEISRHGTLTHYNIRYWSLTSHFNHSVLTHVDSMGQTESLTSADLDLPSRQEDYRVKIAGATRIGESPIASFILVPAVRKMPKPPERFLVKRNPNKQSSGRLFLSWAALGGSHVSKRSSTVLGQRHAPATHAVSDLYIVWCLGSRTSWQCEGNLTWVRLPPNQVTYELVTDLIEHDPYDLLIGVSAQVKTGHDVVSSGIHWSTCVYTRNQKPVTAPQDVRVTPTSVDDESLVVAWRKPGCREEVAYITEYLVRYCPSSSDNKCVGDRLTMNVSGEETRVILPHLARSTKYLVYVVAVSSAGLGPPSEDIWQMIEPKTPEEDLSGLILIVVAIMCLLIVVTSCICFIRCCYRKRQKMPMIDGLLEIEPTQKCPPAHHHHRDRPLPEPPSEALVDHHTYGTSSSAHACMKNPGYEEVRLLLDTGNHEQNSSHDTISRLIEHRDKHDANSMKENGRGWKNLHLSRTLAPSDEDGIVLESTSLLRSPDEESGQIRKSAFSRPDTVQRLSSEELGSSGQSYQKMSFGSSTEETSHADSYTQQVAISLEGSAPQDCDNRTKDAHLLRSPLFARPNTLLMSRSHNEETKFGISKERALLDYVSLNNNVPFSIPQNVQSTVAVPQHYVMHCHAHELLSGAIFSLRGQDFCTCDSNSDDSQSLDINANLPASLTSPMSHKRQSFLIEDILRFPPPPSRPPSPAPPQDPAPPVPTDIPHSNTINHKQEQISYLGTINSSEYLEPRVMSSGY